MISEQFRETASRYRDRVAIVDGGERLRYGDLLDRIAVIRAWIESELDLRPGDVIAASLRNSWQFVACFLASCDLGAIFVPCNPQWREPELRWLIARLGIRGAITEAALRHGWERLTDTLPADRVLDVDRAPAADTRGAQRPRLPSGTSADAPAVYLVTSGSGGVPKIVPRTYLNLCATIRNVGDALGIAPGSRLLTAVPLFHSNGFHNCMLVPLMRGGSVVMVRDFNPGLCAELIAREQVDVLIAVPFVFAMLADHVADARLLASLRLCVSNSARLAADVAHRWRERTGRRIRQSYGMTETSMIAFDGAVGEAPAGLVGTFVGAPLRDVEVKIIADAEHAEPGSHVGEIVVRSAGMMPGYVAAPDWNRQVFRDGFFRTGDLGYIGPDGGLYLTGRLRRGINLAGIKVDPVEIEQVVEALPGVTGCLVDAMPSELVGDVIRARIAVRDGARITRADVLEQCRRRLAEYKLPRVIEFLPSLPVTASGKVGPGWNAETSSGR